MFTSSGGWKCGCKGVFKSLGGWHKRQHPRIEAASGDAQVLSHQREGFKLLGLWMGGITQNIEHPGEEDPNRSLSFETLWLLVLRCNVGTGSRVRA